MRSQDVTRRCRESYRSTLALLALVVIPSALAMTAEAEQTIFDLDTGNLSSGSGDAFTGSVIGLYPDGSFIPVEVTHEGADSAMLDFDLSDVGLPNGNEGFGGARFEYTIQPDQVFGLTLDVATGEINGDLLDPPATLLVEKFDRFGVTPIATTTAPLTISTGVIPVGGGCSGMPRTGLPIDAQDRVTLIGVACVAQLGSSSNMVFDLKLKGVLPVPAPEPASLGWAALLTLTAVAHAGRKSGKKC